MYVHPGLVFNSGPQISARAALTPIFIKLVLTETCHRMRRPQQDPVGCSGPPLPPPPPTLAAYCRCGVEHQSLTDCLEYSGFTILYEAHISIAKDPSRIPPRLPLNPPVVNMMLLSTEGNPVVFFATTILRQFVISDMQTLLGLYLVAYRFLRVSVLRWDGDGHSLLEPASNPPSARY